MTHDQKEQLSRSLLRFLDSNRTRYGVSAGLLLQLARSEGRPHLTQQEVEDALQYLEGKGLIQEANKGIHPENRAWRITSEGIDFVACGGPPE